MKLFPSFVSCGAICRSKKHTFVEHEVYYKDGENEMTFMIDNDIISGGEGITIGNMISDRKNIIDQIVE